MQSLMFFWTASKAAQRGLADTLRLEVMRHTGPRSKYVVQCVFPHNFLTPTFLLEQDSKPALTKYIEATDGVTHEELAKQIPSAGTVARELLIESASNDFAVLERRWVPQLLWGMMVGTSPRRGWGFIDMLLGLLASLLIWPINRYDIERKCMGDALKKK
jgi:3-dehydrosphinganine reductase